VSYLSASAVVFHYEEALYQVHAVCTFTFTLPLRRRKRALQREKAVAVTEDAAAAAVRLWAAYEMPHLRPNLSGHPLPDAHDDGRRAERVENASADGPASH